MTLHAPSVAYVLLFDLQSVLHMPRAKLSSGCEVKPVLKSAAST